MSLLAKATKFLEQAQRELQDSIQRVLTSSHTLGHFPRTYSNHYSADELERELQLFCHRARIHHRARWMATRAAYLEPPRPIMVRQEVTIGEDVTVLDLEPPATIAVADIQAATALLEKNNSRSHCMVCGAGVYCLDPEGNPVRMSQVLCNDCEGKGRRDRDLIGGVDGGKPCPDCALPLAMGCLCAASDD